jgi:hypothetical protein
MEFVWKKTKPKRIAFSYNPFYHVDEDGDALAHPAFITGDGSILINITRPKVIEVYTLLKKENAPPDENYLKLIAKETDSDFNDKIVASACPHNEAFHFKGKYIDSILENIKTYRSMLPIITEKKFKDTDPKDLPIDFRLKVKGKNGYIPVTRSTLPGTEMLEILTAHLMYWYDNTSVVDTHHIFQIGEKM